MARPPARSHVPAALRKHRERLANVTQLLRACGLYAHADYRRGCIVVRSLNEAQRQQLVAEFGCPRILHPHS